MIASGIASKLRLSMSIPLEKSSPVTGHVNTMAPTDVTPGQFTGVCDLPPAAIIFGGAHGPAAYGPDGMRPRAMVRNSAPSGQRRLAAEMMVREVPFSAGSIPSKSKKNPSLRLPAKKCRGPT